MATCVIISRSFVGLKVSEWKFYMDKIHWTDFIYALEIY